MILTSYPASAIYLQLGKFYGNETKGNKLSESVKLKHVLRLFIVSHDENTDGVVTLQFLLVALSKRREKAEHAILFFKLPNFYNNRM